VLLVVYHCADGIERLERLVDYLGKLPIDRLCLTICDQGLQVVDTRRRPAGCDVVRDCGLWPSVKKTRQAVIVVRDSGPEVETLLEPYKPLPAFRFRRD